MADINSAIAEIKQGIAQLATQQYKDCATQVQQDGNSFLEASKADLQTWADQLSRSQLTQQDFEFSVQGMKESFAAAALTQAGIAAIRIATIRTAILNLVIQALIKLIPLP